MCYHFRPLLSEKIVLVGKWLLFLAMELMAFREHQPCGDNDSNGAGYLLFTNFTSCYAFLSLSLTVLWTASLLSPLYRWENGGDRIQIQITLLLSATSSCLFQIIPKTPCLNPGGLLTAFGATFTALDNSTHPKSILLLSLCLLPCDFHLLAPWERC